MSFVLLSTAQALFVLWLLQIVLSELIFLPLVFPVLFLFSHVWQHLALPLTDNSVLEILFPAYHLLNLLYRRARQAPPRFLLCLENASFLMDSDLLHFS